MPLDDVFLDVSILILLAYQIRCLWDAIELTWQSLNLVHRKARVLGSGIPALAIVLLSLLQPLYQ